MSLKKALQLLDPVPHPPEIKDPAEVKEKYEYWRIRIFYSIYIGYVFYYFTRKSFTFITPYLVQEMNFTKSDIGILGSILSITYGISKFTSGIIADRSNPRYFMAIGLLLTAVCNIFFGFASSFILFSFFWGLNGWFQGWGWPACTKQLTHWYGRHERGRWYSVCSTSHTIGGFVIAILAAKCGQYFGWRWGMYIPGILCMFVGIWLINRLRDVPQSLGLPTIEAFTNEAKVSEPESAEPLSAKRILFDQVLNNKYIWILSLSYFFIYVVRVAVNDWGNLYLVEMKSYTPSAAAACVAWFEVGGFLGILVAGWGSDRWFEGKRVPLMVLNSLGLVLAVAGLWYFAVDNFIVATLMISLIGFFVFGPQMLVGLAAAEFVSKKAASTSNGFAGCFAYLGAAVAGFPLGRLTEIWGWHGFILFLIACSIIAVFILLPIWNIRSENIMNKQTAVDIALGTDPDPA